MLRQSLSVEDTKIYVDGHQTRSSCYVDDLIEGVVQMALKKETLMGPINLDNPFGFSMIEIVRKLQQLAGSKSKIIRFPLLADDWKQRKPDITRKRDMLEREPAISLSEGLERAMCDFKSQLQVANKFYGTSAYS